MGNEEMVIFARDGRTSHEMIHLLNCGLVNEWKVPFFHSIYQSLHIPVFVSSFRAWAVNPLSPKGDLSQISHCSIKGLSVGEVMRIENMITSVKFS